MEWLSSFHSVSAHSNRCREFDLDRMICDWRLKARAHAFVTCHVAYFLQRAQIHYPRAAIQRATCSIISDSTHATLAGERYKRLGNLPSASSRSRCTLEYFTPSRLRSSRPNNWVDINSSMFEHGSASTAIVVWKLPPKDEFIRRNPDALP
jgi:hypothetical protein